MGKYHTAWPVYQYVSDVHAHDFTKNMFLLKTVFGLIYPEL